MEKEPKNEESIETPFETYTYFTAKNYGLERTVVFECQARGILEADEMYEEKFGRKREKEKDIACSISPLKQASAHDPKIPEA